MSTCQDVRLRECLVSQVGCKIDAEENVVCCLLVSTSGNGNYYSKMENKLYSINVGFEIEIFQM